MARHSSQLFLVSPRRAPARFPLVLGSQHDLARRTRTRLNHLEVIATLCGAAVAILAQVLLYLMGSPPL